MSELDDFAAEYAAESVASSRYLREVNEWISENEHGTQPDFDSLSYITDWFAQGTRFGGIGAPYEADIAENDRERITGLVASEAQRKADLAISEAREEAQRNRDSEISEARAEAREEALCEAFHDMTEICEHLPEAELACLALNVGPDTPAGMILGAAMSNVHSEQPSACQYQRRTVT